jgi:hypothetical protein
MPRARGGDRSRTALSRVLTVVAAPPSSRCAGAIATQLDSSPPLRLCRCATAVVDGDTCILCGRYIAAPDRSDRPPSAPPKPQWTRAGIVRAIRTFVFFHDRPPSESEWRAQSGATWPSAHAVRRLFGTFDDGLIAAGVDARRQGARG